MLLNTNQPTKLFTSVMKVVTDIESLAILSHYFKISFKATEAACKILKVEKDEHYFTIWCLTGSNLLILTSPFKQRPLWTVVIW